MKIVFIDKKLLRDIRNHITVRSTQGIDAAKSVDSPENTPSTLLALLNEKLSKNQSTQDTLEATFKDISIPDKFYKKTQTDSAFLKAGKLTFTAPICNHAQNKLITCLPFILYLQQCFQQLQEPKENLNKKKLQDNIFSMAARHAIEAGNPLIITAMAALYQHPIAQKLFIQEPAKTPQTTLFSHIPLNLINIFLLPDLVSAYSKQVWSTSNTLIDIQYTLLTPDTTINELIASFQICGQPIEQAIKQNEQTQTTLECAFDINITTDLFPEIANDSEKINKLASALINPLPQSLPQP